MVSFLLLFCHFAKRHVLYFQVYSIRDAAANNVKRLAEEFGPDWAMQHIIPQVLLNICNNCYNIKLLMYGCTKILVTIYEAWELGLDIVL